LGLSVIFARVLGRWDSAGDGLVAEKEDGGCAKVIYWIANGLRSCGGCKAESVILQCSGVGDERYLEVSIPFKSRTYMSPVTPYSTPLAPREFVSVHHRASWSTSYRHKPRLVKTEHHAGLQLALEICVLDPDKVNPSLSAQSFLPKNGMSEFLQVCGAFTNVSTPFETHRLDEAH
jgi:hypothetical protein